MRIRLGKQTQQSAALWLKWLTRRPPPPCLHSRFDHVLCMVTVLFCLFVCICYDIVENDDDDDNSNDDDDINNNKQQELIIVMRMMMITLMVMKMIMMMMTGLYFCCGFLCKSSTILLNKYEYTNVKHSLTRTHTLNVAALIHMHALKRHA